MKSIVLYDIRYVFVRSRNCIDRVTNDSCYVLTGQEGWFRKNSIRNMTRNKID